MVLFSHIDKLKIPLLVDADTDLNKNLQDNGSTLPVGTQPSLPHSPIEDTSVSPSKHPPCPLFDERYTALQARTGDFPDVCLLGANNMLLGFYQNWVYQNPVEHVDVVIADNGK